MSCKLRRSRRRERRGLAADGAAGAAQEQAALAARDAGDLSYLMAGRDVSRLSRDQLARVRGEQIGFVFQGFNLLARTTAVENVELPLLYQGVGSRERHRRAAEALERVGLGDRLEHTSAQLSGGQQQRVAI